MGRWWGACGLARTLDPRSRLSRVGTTKARLLRKETTPGSRGHAPLSRVGRACVRPRNVMKDDGTHTPQMHLGKVQLPVVCHDRWPPPVISREPLGFGRAG